MSQIVQVLTDEGLLGRLWRRAGLLRPDDPELAGALEDLLAAEAERREPYPKTIVTRSAVEWAVEVAARKFHVTQQAVLSRCRSATVSKARALAMALCRARYGATYMELGRAFRRDHTTVISAIRNARTDPTWPLVEAVRAARLR